MRLLVVASVVLAALAVSGCAGKSPSYPDKYMLTSDELPSGLKIGEIPQGVPLGSNPGQIPASLLSGLGDEFAAFAPDQAWIEFVQKASDSDDHITGGLMIAAGFWNDGKKVDDAVAQMRSEEQAELCAQQDQGRALRDGNVVVVIGGDEGMSSYVPGIQAALQSKAPGLASLC